MSKQTNRQLTVQKQCVNKCISTEISSDNPIKSNIISCINEDKDTKEIIENITALIQNGADINFCDDDNNTALHRAVKKADKEIVQFLLRKGAWLIHNKEGKNPLDIAKETESNIAKDIAKLIESNIKVVKAETIQYETQNEVLYLKRPGTSGVSGQFYETKLLCLVQYRALHREDVESFLLATNINDIGDFDDVCFRCKIKGQEEMFFLQAKHKDDPDKGRLTVASIKSTTGDFSLLKYFDSYLKISGKFSADNPDAMFRGEFKDLKCNFILYTPLKSAFDKKRNDSVDGMLDTFINTSDTEKPFQYNYDDNDVSVLAKVIMEDRVKVMAPVLLEYALAKKSKHAMMLVNTSMKTFHPALARKVITVSEVKDDYRIAKFRPDLFESNEDILVILKETLCITVANEYIIEKLSINDIENRIKAVLETPSVELVSKLFSVVTFDDKKFTKLYLNETKLPKNLKKEDIVKYNDDLHKLQLTPEVIKDAVMLVGRMKLHDVSFKVPAPFGNSDLTIRGNDKKVDSRLNHIAEKIHDLIVEFRDTNIIDISNETVGPDKILDAGMLDINGGISGAVGNILDNDENSDMLVFKTAASELPDKAQRLLNILLSKEPDLSKYKINVKLSDFPRTNFKANDHDKDLVRGFLNRLWFYMGQAQEDGVERLLKNEIELHCHEKFKGVSQTHTDAIFLSYHDEVQKWWKTATKAPYLTKANNIFEGAKLGIVRSLGKEKPRPVFTKSPLVLHFQVIPVPMKDVSTSQ